MALPLSQDERILLHLSKFARFRDEWDVPAEIAQEGIGQRLDILVNNVSRALTSLVAKGLVEERLAHVRGRPRRLKTYFLTERGRRSVEDTEGRLRAATAVVELGGSTKEMTLAAVEEALTRTRGRAPELLRLVDAIRAGRTRDADLSEGLGDTAAPLAPRFQEFLEGAPDAAHFVGRAADLEAIDAAFSGPDVTAVVLWGLAGIGKSSLAARALERHRGRTHLFLHRCAEWDTLRGLVASVAPFLQAAGRNRLAAARRQRWTSPTELIAPLAADLHGLPAILAFDDVHTLTAEASPFLAVALEAARRSGAHLVLISRTVPTVYGRGEAAGGAILEREVGGLTEAEARALLPDLSGDAFAAAFVATRGHPLFLRLLAAGGGGGTDLARYIEQEIYEGLSGPERAALRSLAVHRLPVPAGALPGGDAVAALRDRGLVHEIGGRFDLHDLIREFLLSRLSREERVGLHRAAAAHWRASSPAEALHHLIEAEAWPEATTLAVDIVPALLEEDPTEGSRLLEGLPKERVPSGQWADLLYCRGLARERLGDSGGALEAYREAAALEERSGTDKATLALLQQRIAGLPPGAAGLSASLAEHEKALCLFREAKDREGETTELLSLGALHRQRGDGPAARKVLDAALAAAKALKSDRLRAAAEYHLALADFEAGDLVGAATRFQGAERSAVTAGDAVGATLARGGIAEAEFLRGNRKRALQVAGELSAQALDTATGRPAREALLRFARLLQSTGELETALRFARDAARRPAPRFLGTSRPQEVDLEAESLAATLCRVLGRKEATAHRDEAIRVVWALGRPSRVGREILERALDAEARGHLDDADAALKEAAKVLRSAGEVRGLVAVYLTWGRIEEKREDARAAEERYEEAARWAETAGDALGQARALESLGEVTGPRGRESLLRAKALYVQLARHEDVSRVEILLA